MVASPIALTIAVRVIPSAGGSIDPTKMLFPTAAKRAPMLDVHYYSNIINDYRFNYCTVKKTPLCNISGSYTYQNMLSLLILVIYTLFSFCLFSSLS